MTARSRDMAGLLAFFTLCFAVSALGGWATSTSVESWYRTLQRPSFAPPNAVFAPVWTTLFVMIAVAGWRVWRRSGLAGARTAMILYGIQLALNLGWSVLFFGLQMISTAFFELLVLLATVVATAIAFWRHDRLASLLLVPYILWSTFAAALNLAFWRLN